MIDSREGISSYLCFSHILSASSSTKSRHSVLLLSISSFALDYLFIYFHFFSLLIFNLRSKFLVHSFFLCIRRALWRWRVALVVYADDLSGLVGFMEYPYFHNLIFLLIDTLILRTFHQSYHKITSSDILNTFIHHSTTSNKKYTADK